MIDLGSYAAGPVLAADDSNEPYLSKSFHSILLFELLDEGINAFQDRLAMRLTDDRCGTGRGACCA